MRKPEEFEPFESFAPLQIETHTVALCLQCGRLLSRCLADPCHLKVIDGEFTVVRPELPAPEESDDACD